MRLPLGALLVLGAATGGGLHLLERDHPLVEQGLDAYQAGDYEKALGAFDAARAKLPEDATVELNRGNALYRLNRMEEAVQAYQHATELDARKPGQLQARDEYNLGTTLAQMGKKKEAIRALRQSLLKNPQDEDARHNLEVLLRDLQKNQPPSAGDGGQDAGQDAGPTDGGHPDAGQDAGPETDAGQDGGPGDAGSDAGSDGGVDGGADGGSGGQQQGKDGGQSDAGPPDAGQGQGQMDAGPDAGQDAGEGQEPKPQEADPADGGTPPRAGEPLDKQETERMLDAIRQNERNLQLWRFQQKKRRSHDTDKDW